MKRTSIFVVAVGLAVGWVLVPISRILADPGHRGGGTATCECTGGVGGTEETCGQCTGKIKLPLGCALCCDGTTCSKKDGPGTGG